MKKDKRALCLDPDSEQFFLLSLNTGQIKVLTEVPENMKEIAFQTVEKLKTLRELGEIKSHDMIRIKPLASIEWNFNTTTVAKFRRRRLPFYLLHKDFTSYPTFLHDANLSLAFAVKDDQDSDDDSKKVGGFGAANSAVSKKVKDTIKINVNVVEYIDQLMDPKEVEEFRNDKNGNNTYVPITINGLIVSSCDAIIKTILKVIFKQCNKKIKPKELENKFVLRATGYLEYIMGGAPLLSYDCIRICLRASRPFECTLTEIAKTISVNTNFPPIITTNWSTDKKEMSEGAKEFQIDWDSYKNCPMLMWYPSMKLPSIKELSTEDPVESHIIKRFYQQNQVFKPRALTHWMMDDFMKKRHARLKSREIQIGAKQIAFSGESDFPFRMRINGLDNVQGLVKLYLAKATENGLLEPHYITHRSRLMGKMSKEEKELHEMKRKKKKKADPPNIPIQPGMPPVHKVPENFNHHDDESLNSAINIWHSNHSSKGAVSIANIAQILDLPFIPYLITCEISLLHGISLLRKDLKVETSPRPFSNNPRWNEWIEFPNLKISQLPLETKIGINIKIYSQKGESLIIGAIQKHLFDEKGHFPNAFNQMNVWPFYKVDKRLSCMGDFEGMISKNNRLINEMTKLAFEFDSFNTNVVYSLREQSIQDLLGMPHIKTKEEQRNRSKMDEVPNYAELALCNQLIGYNPLKWDSYDEKERLILLKCRNHVSMFTSALPIFICAIDFLDPEQVKIAHEMIKKWGLMNPEDALCLLDAQFADEMVRLYAVRRISSMTDETISLYLPELVIALLYEPQHFSPLGELLVERSLRNKSVVGHELYWTIRSQFHLKISLERYMLILEEFVMLCGSFRETLLKDISVNNFLYAIQKEISEEISNLKDEDKKNEVCQRKLKEHHDGESLYPLPDKFTFPHDSRLESVDFKYKSCKIMNSKKEPLWIETVNSVPGAEDLKIMFKSGDDLRQDILTLQLIKIMDKMWLDQGLDYKMKPYRVMATMDQVGFIEIVKRSQTTAKIHKMQGGRLGALRENTIKLYLEKTNPPGPKYEKARETFKRSCAAYCIATYIMGIGDRHSDNIMVSDEGHLFHIDFGHFLGNFKTKLGINRERSAFVFQREMGYVIGIKNPDDFDDFLKRCTTAYNIIRKNANIFVNVFLMMISAGMPELRKKDNLNYLTKQLSLDLSEQEASEKFKKELIASLNDTWRSVDNLIHNLKRQ